jgi:hypothetical protein
MKRISKFTEFDNQKNVDMYKQNESTKDLKSLAEDIYNLVKNRPFQSKRDCVIDIVKILQKV